jgi:ribosomal protein S18 acetylase RimI-like enzyme
MKITSIEALAKLAQLKQPFLELFEHGSLSVEMYKPDKIDLQQPHERDEIYVIASGAGQFEHNGVLTAVVPGDFLFVPAFEPHRFVDFTGDFATWVFFYGPVGGEAPLQVSIQPWQPAFKEAFFKLNKAWIEADYPLEPLDIAVLSAPEEHIIQKGGTILSAIVGTQVVGVVALRPFEPNAPELTKMAVDVRWRGRGIGKELMLAALEAAKEQGAQKVVLFSNSITSAKAVKMYFNLGFKEIPLESGIYTRANIKMEYLFT